MATVCSSPHRSSRVSTRAQTPAHSSALTLRAHRGVDYGAYKLTEWFGLQVTGGSGTVSGAGGLSTAATSLTYSGNQVDAGTYYVTAHYAGDASFATVIAGMWPDAGNAAGAPDAAQA